MHLLRLHLFAALLALPAALAQAPTLALDFGNVYLSGVSRPPDGLESYRQTYVVRTVRVAGGQETASDYRWLHEVAPNGDRHWREETTGGLMDSVAAHYLVGGRAFVYGENAGTVSCVEADAFAPGDPAITVSDVTGFMSAALVGEGESVNGVLADRYRLEPPAFNNFFDPASLEGELWLARDGGFIVKFLARGSSRSVKEQSWSYDLEVGEPVGVELPAACG